MMRSAAAMLAVMAVAACTSSAIAPTGTPEVARAVVPGAAENLPPPRRFDGRPDIPVPAQPNGQLARDFMALTFQLETGRQLDTFTRFEGPIRVAVEVVGGTVPPTLGPDLDDLLARLRDEAGIDIARAGPDTPASLVVTALPRALLQRHVPGAACFVVPRVSGWKDYLARRSGAATDWTTLTTRTRASVFLPTDVSPQEIRDCLHEEVAQALGPLNDLYRLPWSVFNDDNLHVVLTPYDMTLLRATYDPALASGMGRADVAARLPGVLARLNPAGRTADGAAVPEATADWTRALQAALSPGGTPASRLAQAQTAVTLSRAAGWTDARDAISQLALGRAAMPLDAGTAIAALVEAGRIYRRLNGEGLQTAQVAMQLAAFALGAGDPEAALMILGRAVPAAEGAQNADLLATLLLLRAEALEQTGSPEAAARDRRRGLSWGRYAWGDGVLALRAAEVASLRPEA